MPDLTPEFLETLYDEIPEPVFVFVPVREDGRVVDFRYLYANPAAARIVGTSPAVRFANGLRADAPDVELFISPKGARVRRVDPATGAELEVLPWRP